MSANKSKKERRAQKDWKLIASTMMMMMMKIKKNCRQKPNTLKFWVKFFCSPNAHTWMYWHRNLTVWRRLRNKDSERMWMCVHWCVRMIKFDHVKRWILDEPKTANKILLLITKWILIEWYGKAVPIGECITYRIDCLERRWDGTIVSPRIINCACLSRSSFHLATVRARNQCDN